MRVKTKSMTSDVVVSLKLHRPFWISSTQAGAGYFRPFSAMYRDPVRTYTLKETIFPVLPDARRSNPSADLSIDNH